MIRLILASFLSVGVMYGVTPEVCPKVITYETSSGRFGDNLLSYIHAKYISHLTNIPVSYRPFVYSNELCLSDLELTVSNRELKKYRHHFRLKANRLPQESDPAGSFYLCPYFPDSKWEQINCISYQGGRWEVLPMMWTPEFVDSLRPLIKPKHELTFPKKPEDRISVAIHVRRGGNHDGHYHFLNPGFPLKFIPVEELCNELRVIRKVLNDAPLYVYLFTDDNDPPRVMCKFTNEFQGEDIVFECRESGNHDRANVIYDFFHMMEFDCLIYSESNYSYIPSHFGNYLVKIRPKTFDKKNRMVIYTEHELFVNKSHPKYPL